MSKEISFTLDDRSADIMRAFENCEDEFLEALGIQGVGNVVNEISEKGAVDTGLMRNSIAYAVSGKQPVISITDSGKRQRTYKPGPTHEKTGKPVTAEEAEKMKHTYTGHAPKAEAGHKAVYIGSAVEYFPAQNLGYHRPNGTFVPGIHALEDGMTQLQGKAEEIARKIFKSVGEG